MGIVTLFMSAMAILEIPPHRCFAQTVLTLPPRLADAPDLQVIVMGGLPTGDVVNVTYAGVPSSAALTADLSLLSQQLGVSAADEHVTTEGLPANGGETPPMTSVTFNDRTAAPANTGSLPVDKLIVALRNYHRLAITYIMPTNYRYTGVRRYTDRNVAFQLNQSGSTFVYSVTIASPDFTRLSLPNTDPAANVAPVNGSGELQYLLWYRIGGIGVVLIFAMFVGWGVYAALAKLQKAS
jgi:hypothetical protein